jgi:hypothetical protein
MSKILFIGDVVGKGGRKILREVLPQWREKYQPDVVIANVENLAHGRGVTIKTMEELSGKAGSAFGGKDLKIDAYTSGNHIFKTNDLSAECFEKYPNLIRPANFAENLPGHGYYRFAKKIHPPLTPPIKGGELDSSLPPVGRAREGGEVQQYLVLNLNGQVFMEKQFDGEIVNPFLAVDRLLTQQAQKGDIIIVDFHAEATSEKIAFGWHVDGKVTGVFGTHTHVPTADARVLPNGTAYITDVGMTGAKDGVIGVKKGNVLPKFLDPNVKFKNEPEEEGMLQINGVLIETSAGGKAAKIEKLYEEIG